MSNKLATFFGVAAFVIVLDQATKWVLLASVELHDSIPVFEGWLSIVHVRNPGAAFSVFATAPEWFRGPFFLVMTIVAVAVLVTTVVRLDAEDRFLSTALGGVLGGAVGNLIDRLLYGEVIDFIDVHWREYHWPAFNVADSSISIAVVALVLHSFVAGRANRRQKSPAVGHNG